MGDARVREEVRWGRLGFFWLGLFVLMVLLDLVLPRRAFVAACVVALLVVIASLVWIVVVRIRGARR